MKKSQGLVALLFTALILGTFGVWVREQDKMFGNNSQVLARSVVAMTIMAFIMILKKINFKIDKSNYKYLAIFSIVFPLSLVLFTYSATRIKVANTLFMLFVGILFSTAVWGKLVFKEKFSWQKIVALILALIGVYLFIYPFSIQKFSLGLVAGLLAGILEGTAHAMRKLMKNTKREVVVFFQSFSAVAVTLILILVNQEQVVKVVQLTSILAAVIHGALLVAIGYLLVYGFTHYDVNRGSIVLTSELAFAVVINLLFLREVPTLFEILGGVIIAIAVILPEIQFSNKQKPQEH